MDKDLLHMQVEAIYERLGDRPLVISLNRAAQLLGKDRRTLLSDATFPVIHKGKTWVVPVLRLAAWILRGTKA